MATPPVTLFTLFSSTMSRRAPLAFIMGNLIEFKMTSAAEHLPPEYSVSTSLCLLMLGGLEEIALCTAGDVLTFIACGTGDLFPVPLTAMQREREREDYCSTTPTFSARLGADGLETFFLFFYSSLLFQGRRPEMFSAKTVAEMH